MKFLHISDLHIGKRLHGFSLYEDQRYIFDEIIKIGKEKRIDVLLLAGDIYDKANPSAEAVKILDEFLTQAAASFPYICMISGNHDSPDRLSFGKELLKKGSIYIGTSIEESRHPITIEDEYGYVHFYLLPFVKPALVRASLGEEADTFDEAVKTCIRHMNVDIRQRNILLSHQFVQGASICESEEIWVGGQEQVSTEAYKDFDYVALGHLHGPQKVGKDWIQYCGTPLAYSFSERNHEKSVLFGEIKEKGDLYLERVKLHPLRRIAHFKGTYEEVTLRSFYEDKNTEDFVFITLTDREEILDGASLLRTIYPNLMSLEYEKNHILYEAGEVTQGSSEIVPGEIFLELFQKQNGEGLTKEEEEYLEEKINEIWGKES